jgi:ketopantoate reductase
MIAADILAEAVADARPAVWEKFTYLAPFAAFTGASRLPIGPLWKDEEIRPMFVAAVNEVRAVAAGYSVPLAADYLEKLNVYVAKLPPSTRSSPSLISHRASASKSSAAGQCGAAAARSACRRRHGRSTPC